MRQRVETMFALAALIMLVPTVAAAQASIAGTVRDGSGAFLPGVTVEVSSPAMIEKTRSTVTAGTGQYQVLNLPPGIYAVTYTLAGFNLAKREGIELTGSFTASVNVEMEVGGLEETVTVTGASPIIDLRNAARERVMDREIIDAIPSGRTNFTMAVLIPGMNISAPATGASAQDVGGANGNNVSAGLQIHGGKIGDQQVARNGVLIVGSHQSGFSNPMQVNMTATQEQVVDTTRVSAETASGGVRINDVYRDGGNRFNGTVYVNFATEALASSNFSSDLQAAGLRAPNTIKYNYDFNPGFGGPVIKSRLWFFAAARVTEQKNRAAGMFLNRNANNPNAWTYEPDTSRPAYNETRVTDGQVRLTWQASRANKIGFTWQEQTACFCPEAISPQVAPEAAGHREYPGMTLVQVDWTSPVTNRLLFEAGGVVLRGTSNLEIPSDLNPSMIAVREQSTGLLYRSGDDYRDQPFPATHLRAAFSFITGAYMFKGGITHSSGHVEFHALDNTPVSYQFNNGIPNQITQRALPFDRRTDIDHNLGVFAQNQWTRNRLTLHGGLRFDYFANSFPEQYLGPTLFAPTRNLTYPAQENLSYKDITPRLGAVVDVFGNGQTAVRVTLNKYLQSLATSFIAGDPNPLAVAITSANRAWVDGNGNFVPDCDLANRASQNNLAAGGDLCGPIFNPLFGTGIPGGSFDPDVLRGWSERFYNWEFSAGVQHELVPRVAVDVSYFRRWYGNFLATDNRAVDLADYDTFSITAPVDPRLPGGGGYQISGLYDLKSTSFARQSDDFVTSASAFGKQIERWNGVDVSVNARPRAGMLLQAGISTGRTLTDNCEIVAKVPEALYVAFPPPATWQPGQYCRKETPFLTQAKLLGTYTVPKIDVQVSATFQSLPGPEISALYTATNDVVAPSLGRSLSGGVQNITVNLVQPGTMYGERLNQVDLRLGKILRFGTTRSLVSVDLYNLFNANTVLTLNNNYGAWQAPQQILLARFAKFAVQIDF